MHLTGAQDFWTHMLYLHTLRHKEKERKWSERSRGWAKGGSAFLFISIAINFAIHKSVYSLQLQSESISSVNHHKAQRKLLARYARRFIQQPLTTGKHRDPNARTFVDHRHPLPEQHAMKPERARELQPDGGMWMAGQLVRFMSIKNEA